MTRLSCRGVCSTPEVRLKAIFLSLALRLAVKPQLVSCAPCDLRQVILRHAITSSFVNAFR